MNLYDIVQQALNADNEPGIIKDIVMCYSYIDEEGAELLCVRTTGPLSNRLGLIAYLELFHRSETIDLIEEEAL